MPQECAHENCFADTACALGYRNRGECPHWGDGEQSGDNVQEKPMRPSPSDVPWNGYALGSSDLAVLAGRGRPLVIGLVGPPDSGKTSLLAFLYMWLLANGRLGPWTFAGSWTLGGWETVVDHCRWSGVPPPSFPPHTSSAGRHPGILHFAARHDSGVLRDLLFTDAPGEWFTRWARVPEDPTAAGARWVVEHADALLLLVDSGALADPQKLPSVRRATRDLVERVAAVSDVPVTVVWTKNDVAVPDVARQAVERACAHLLENAATAMTTVRLPESVADCFSEAVAAAVVSVPIAVADGPLSKDPFLAYRGLHVTR